MTDEKEQKPDEGLPKRRDDSEKAIGLEMARLFGMNPKLMMAPKPTPQKPPGAADEDDDGQPDA
jgi:hypothetical protein